jgi:hypothetical protein
MENDMNDLNIVLSGLKNEDKSTFDILDFLVKKKKESENSNNNDLVKRLDLLCDIFTIELQGNDSQCPYASYIPTSNGRRFDICNMSDAEICLLIEMADPLMHRQIKARIMDILWLTRGRWKNFNCNISPSNPITYAEQVMEAYLPSSINKVYWTQWVFREISRCAVLAKQTKKTIIMDKLVKLLESMILSSTIDDGLIPIDGLKIIMVHNPRYYNNSIMQKLEGHARSFSNRKDPCYAHFAQECYSYLSALCDELGDKDNAVRLKIEVGHVYMREGGCSASSTNYLRAALCYMFAFNAYRSIPNIYREGFNVEQLMIEAQKKQIEAGKNIHLNGYRIEQQINLEQMIEETQRSVAGKTLHEIIRYICDSEGPNVDEMRKCAGRRLEKSLLHHISSIIIPAADGRIIKNLPSFDNSDEASREVHIQLMMLQSYSYFIGITVYGLLFPVLNILRESYKITEQDIQGIVEKSPIIPKDRIKQWTKGLLAGFQLDFLSAIYLLAPQVEHIIRTYLKNNFDVDTMTTIDGEQSEKGLSTLMKDSIINQAFDANFAFEIKALFCEKAGPNLRNNVAHGLLSDDSAESDFVVYAWWLALKIAFKPNCLKTN